MLEKAQARPITDDTTVVLVSPVAGRTSLQLKSWLPEYRKGARPVLLAGLELPSQVGTALSASVMRVLCVGPGEWLIVSQEHEAESLRAHVGPDLAPQGLALVDLSDGLTVLEARGFAIREIFSKGCGLDLHPSAFLAGRCARARLAQIPVVIDCVGNPSVFELYVPRSYSGYLRAWFSDAALEFGGAL
jgi:sarcosine oxidase subunit gamma